MKFKISLFIIGFAIAISLSNQSAVDFSILLIERAREKEKSISKQLQSLEAGVISSSATRNQRTMETLAKATRKDKSIFGPVMMNPVSVYRSCLYPYSQANYLKWCAKVNFLQPEKILSCRLSFCNVCCDNLPLEFKHAATTASGERLQLSSDILIEQMSDFILQAGLKEECKAQCSKTYPSKLPIVPNTPARDPSLGISKANPARDCADIKAWGGLDLLSGKYWVQIPFKGIVEVYCDLETDGGGWTMFVHYDHSPGQAISLNSNV